MYLLKLLFGSNFMQFEVIYTTTVTVNVVCVFTLQEKLISVYCNIQEICSKDISFFCQMGTYMYMYFTEEVQNILLEYFH